MLVHGLASNARTWDGVAAELARQGRASIAVDLRGHGYSDKPDDGYSVPDVADDVLDLIARLGLERPVVAGQSWGGNVVIEAAARGGDAMSAVDRRRWRHDPPRGRVPGLGVLRGRARSAEAHRDAG